VITYILDTLIDMARGVVVGTALLLVALPSVQAQMHRDVHDHTNHTVTDVYRADTPTYAGMRPYAGHLG
jgi:hypothetical protein